MVTTNPIKSDKIHRAVAKELHVETPVILSLPVSWQGTKRGPVLSQKISTNSSQTLLVECTKQGGTFSNISLHRSQIPKKSTHKKTPLFFEGKSISVYKSQTNPSIGNYFFFLIKILVRRRPKTKATASFLANE